jgi:hypothetical protein
MNMGIESTCQGKRGVIPLLLITGKSRLAFHTGKKVRASEHHKRINNNHIQMSHEVTHQSQVQCREVSHHVS